MVLQTLDAMSRGGIHDHLAGGFHRYAVDRQWHVPHFEKMLYDQAQLAVVYSEAFQITHQPRYARVLCWDPGLRAEGHDFCRRRFLFSGRCR